MQNYRLNMFRDCHNFIVNIIGHIMGNIIHSYIHLPHADD